VDQGTAVVVTTGVVVDGTSGEAVSATGSIAGASTALPEVTIDNEFAMDIRWQTNNGHTTRNGNNVDARFQWSLFHGAGADPGSDSVSYTITPRTSTGSTVTAAGCQAFTTRGGSGHPYSGGDHPADRVAPFVDTCTLTANGNGTFTLTLSGIDYSKSHVPTHDSTGAPLPLGTDVVAAGQITLRVLNAPNAGNLEISVSAPQYVGPTGDTHADDSTNNSSATTWTSGAWSAGWRPNYTGQSLPSWSDTYRAAPGTRVQQNVSLLYGRDPSSITVSSFQSQQHHGQLVPAVPRPRLPLRRVRRCTVRRRGGLELRPARGRCDVLLLHGQLRAVEPRQQLLRPEQVPLQRHLGLDDSEAGRPLPGPRRPGHGPAPDGHRQRLGHPASADRHQGGHPGRDRRVELGRVHHSTPVRGNIPTAAPT